MTKLQLGSRSSEILINRGMKSVEAATRYLNPSLADLHDPFLFEDMEKVVERILKAKETHEKICLYGDYDADGTTGVAILLNFLRSNGFNVSFFIPNRLITGYGLHQTPLQEIIDDGITLLITVDNGISANEQIDFCQHNHLDVIITDHHECQGILPPAYGIINPKVPGSTYPFKDLCGAGVAFKLAQAISQRLQVEMDIQNAIECVALATVADLVSLQDENRSLVSIGLNYLNTNPSNLGIRALMTVSELTVLKAWHFGFILGPKINAAGRLGEANYVVELLTGSDPAKLMDLAHYLSEENRKRQDLESTILAEALSLVENEKLFHDDIIIVVGENWHPGVIGIVASRIQEKYFNPVIVISVENNIGKASCRSIEGFSIFAALKSCSDCFASFGGHDQAAGFSIKTENIKEMSARVKAYGESVGIKKYLVKTYSYDAIIDEAEISWELLNECTRFEPCGIGNPGVQFVLNHPEIKSMGTMGKENNHLRLTLKNDIRGVGFGLGNFNKKFQELPKSVSNAVKMLCRLDVNDYQGNKTLQVLIKDIKINPIWQIDRAMFLVKTIVQQQNPKVEIDFEAVAINLADLYLDREMVKKVYLLLKKSNDHGVTLYAGDKAKISPFHLLMSCEILREVGLIAYRLKEGLIFSKILETKEKKDIQKTKLMIKLVKITSE